VAALIPEARAARVEARRLRVESVMLKRALRESNAHSLEQLRDAEDALSRVRARRSEPLPSPWSTLRWLQDDEALAVVLVSVS
jgi:hypothetical protein